MEPVAPDAVLAQLRWRYATKKFDPTRKISPEWWAKLEEAVRLSPSSYGLQPWKFVVVTDPAVRAALHPFAWKQPQILDASHLVVFCRKRGMNPADVDRHVRRVAEVRNVPVDSLADLRNRMSGSVGGRPVADVDNWASRQVYLALGVFLTSAALLGVDACPMEGFQPEKFDEVLGLPQQGYGAVVLAAAGYRSADDPSAAAAKVRFPHEEVIEHR